MIYEDEDYIRLDNDMAEMEERSGKVVTMHVEVTKMYEVTYTISDTLDLDDAMDEMEEWTTIRLKDEEMDAEQLINQTDSPNGIEVVNSSHCSGSDELTISGVNIDYDPYDRARKDN